MGWKPPSTSSAVRRPPLPALRLRLGPATTFLPVTPTVHLAVGGHSLDALLRLRALLVGSEPLDRADPHDFVAHVTLAQELLPPERIEAAIELFAAWRAEVRFDRVHVLRQGDDRVWAPMADARLSGSKS